MKKNRFSIIAAVTMMSLALSGCAGTSQESSGSAGAQSGAKSTVNQVQLSDGGTYSADNGNTDGSVSGDVDSGYSADSGTTSQDEVKEGEDSDSSRKLIRTVSISAETEKYDKLVSEVNAQTTKLGGYVENSDESLSDSDDTESGRYISMTLRIPKDKADKLIDSVSKESNITARSENSEDVTLEYTDIASHEKALKAEEKRLMELMDSAEKMSDVIAIEDKLADVRYNIDSIESQIRVYDNQVDYTTVNLDITEVKTYSATGEESTGERIASGFMKSLKGVGHGLVEFFIWFVTHIPYIVIWAAVIFLIIWICRKCSKKSEAKKEKMRQQYYANYMKQNGPQNNGFQQNAPQNNGFQQNDFQNIPVQQNKNDAGKDKK